MDDVKDQFLKDFAKETEPGVFDFTYHSEGCQCPDANSVNTIAIL